MGGVNYDFSLPALYDGEESFEHSEQGHRKRLYDEVLRIPLILS